MRQRSRPARNGFLALRLASQRLSRHGLRTPAEVVAWMGAVRTAVALAIELLEAGPSVQARAVSAAGRRYAAFLGLDPPGAARSSTKSRSSR